MILQWMHWHEKSNVLFAGSVGGDVFMWHIPDGACKIFQGFGQRTMTAVLLGDGMEEIAELITHLFL